MHTAIHCSLLSIALCLLIFRFLSECSKKLSQICPCSEQRDLALPDGEEDGAEGPRDAEAHGMRVQGHEVAGAEQPQHDIADTE